MKKLIVLLTLALVMCGCSNLFPPSPIPTKGDVKNTQFFVVEYDGCEYIMRATGHRGYLAHKGNCIYCAERRKKEQEELIRKIKEQ
jgi:hypothetical protein